MHVTVADLQEDHGNGPGVRGQQEQAQPGVVQQAQYQVASGVGDTVCYSGRTYWTTTSLACLFISPATILYRRAK